MSVKSMLSIFLPKTGFSLKGSLSKQEPMWIAWWQAMDLYRQKRQVRAQCPLYVLHDGPPFSNAPIHMGHALNKILKDITCRWHFAQGMDVCFVPGWDCHGLPTEAKIEEEYRKKKGQNKSDVPVETFRKDCREFSQHWIGVQKAEFQRLGISADWEHPYKTMDFAFEARIVRQFFRLMEKGYVYRGVRPVLWSPVEQTALAEAEVEYKDVTSKAIFVKFPVQCASDPRFTNSSVLIWTTTPWSLPGNRAIAYAPDTPYVCVAVEDVTEASRLIPGEKIWMAEACYEDVCKTLGIQKGKTLHTVEANALQDVICHHPLREGGYTHDVPLLPGDHVTTTAGTGFVHTAPSHGMEDFILGQKYQLEVPETVNAEGIFVASVPMFAGLPIWKASPAILGALGKALAHESDYLHSCPHSWRSRTQLLYRATPQWFIALDGVDGNGQKLGPSLRQAALDILPKVHWYDARAQRRLADMIASRPDWCVSRQRTWGVPIAEFLHKETGEPMADAMVHARIVERISQEGTDFWFTDKAWTVLDGTSYCPEDWTKVVDILDVWFESGVTHEVVLKEGIPADMIPPIQWPASLYLEGSDQFRGWFQSSLLLSVALEGSAPFKGVVSHGFLLDEHGRKMSKSLGNGTEPQEITSTKGADILRLWVAHEDYQRDLRFGPAILSRVEDLYRRFRNTWRYLLGALKDLTPEELLSPTEFPLLEQWVHHQLWALQTELQQDGQMYSFQSMMRRLHLFCSVDLSAFYFDVCKDSLYCDGVSSLKRRAIRTTFLHVFVRLTHWMAPILCFTAEEAWHTFAKEILGVEDPMLAMSERIPSGHGAEILAYLHQNMGLQNTPYWSIHLSAVSQTGLAFPESHAIVEKLQNIRDTVLSALEKSREKKEITSSLQAYPTVYLSRDTGGYDTLFSSQQELEQTLEALCLTSGLSIVWDAAPPSDAIVLDAHPTVGVGIALADGGKCSRCWRILPEVVSSELGMCLRCQSVQEEIC